MVRRGIERLLSLETNIIRVPRKILRTVFPNAVPYRVIADAPACPAVPPLEEEHEGFWIQLWYEHHAAFFHYTFL